MKKNILKISLSIVLCLSTLNSYAGTFDKPSFTYEQMYDETSMSYYKKGRELYNKLSQKSLEEALTVYDKGLEINKNNPLLYAGKSETLYMLYLFKFFRLENNINKVKTEYEVFRNAIFALDLAPNLAESHKAMALAYSIQDRKDEAIEEAKKFLEYNKTDPEANLWYWYLQEGKKPDPEKPNAVMALTLAPESPLINFFISFAYAEKEVWNGNKTIELIKKIIEKSPDNDLAYMFLGNTYFKFNYDSDLIIKNYEKALQIEPINPYALMNLGFIYLRKRDDLKAVEYFRKSCDQGLKGSCEILKSKNY